LSKARREYRAILDACLADDGDRAATLTRAYILDASHSLVALLKRERKDQD
jgi:DNA-binding GntR family transcriptional regulator